jgi:hypothetical protein
LQTLLERQRGPVRAPTGLDLVKAVDETSFKIYLFFPSRVPASQDGSKASCGRFRPFQMANLTRCARAEPRFGGSALFKGLIKIENS